MGRYEHHQLASLTTRIDALVDIPCSLSLRIEGGGAPRPCGLYEPLPTPGPGTEDGAVSSGRLQLDVMLIMVDMNSPFGAPGAIHNIQ
ncbi:hypothetical protein EYF80_019854 [Liparis tanakae]|uniref:Uncharacterized protein n=1 Tax=Liparis tanakae TaxID=230148 RepID=A0A4Z2HWM9_9TELE|nr:hypothetical protein EYF80_019854 [Liparis tanakae]